MKKVFILTFGLILIISASFSAGNWVAKVDGVTVNTSQFQSMLNAQQSLLEATQGRSMDYQFKNKQFRQQILQMQIMQQLMVNEIKSINAKKHFVSPSVIQAKKAAIANLLEKALWLSYYQQKVLRPQVSVSSKAITKFYNNNKAKTFKNVTKTQAAPFIREELTLQQLQPLLVQLQNKVKSEHSVTINTNFFK